MPPGLQEEVELVLYQSRKDASVSSLSQCQNNKCRQVFDASKLKYCPACDTPASFLVESPNYQDWEFVCVDCGAEVSKDDSFCSRCGSNVEEIRENLSIECSGCGSKADMSVNYCPECGGKFEGGVVMDLDSYSHITSSQGISKISTGTKITISMLALALLIVFTPLIFQSLSGKSEAYKDGWNDQWDTLQGSLISQLDSRKVSCAQWGETYVEWRGLGVRSQEYKDYVRGCSDWRESGKNGLERK